MPVPGVPVPVLVLGSFRRHTPISPPAHPSDAGFNSNSHSACHSGLPQAGKRLPPHSLDPPVFARLKLHRRVMPVPCEPMSSLPYHVQRRDRESERWDASKPKLQPLIGRERAVRMWTGLGGKGIKGVSISFCRLDTSIGHSRFQLCSVSGRVRSRWRPARSACMGTVRAAGDHAEKKDMPCLRSGADRSSFGPICCQIPQSPNLLQGTWSV